MKQTTSLSAPSWSESDDEGKPREAVIDSATNATLAELVQRIDALTFQIKILDDNHSQFHEGEFLNLIFRSLIPIADRCRQETDRLLTILKGYGSDKYRDAVSLSIRQLIDAREADLIEVEAVLATFGVERFQHLRNQFDPSLQKCIQRIETSKPERHQRIASRVLPGYHRDGKKVVRRELVSVYVFVNSMPEQQ